MHVRFMVLLLTDVVRNLQLRTQNLNIQNDKKTFFLSSTLIEYPKPTPPNLLNLLFFISFKTPFLCYAKFATSHSLICSLQLLPAVHITSTNSPALKGRYTLTQGEALRFSPHSVSPALKGRYTLTQGKALRLSPLSVSLALKGHNTLTQGEALLYYLLCKVCNFAPKT